MGTGDYRVEYFDVYGYKLDKEPADSLTHGIEIGNRKLADEVFASFRVIRCVYNSIDQRERWQAKG